MKEHLSGACSRDLHLAIGCSGSWLSGTLRHIAERTHVSDESITKPKLVVCFAVNVLVLRLALSYTASGFALSFFEFTVTDSRRDL